MCVYTCMYVSMYVCMDLYISLKSHTDFSTSIYSNLLQHDGLPGFL